MKIRPPHKALGRQARGAKTASAQAIERHHVIKLSSWEAIERYQAIKLSSWEAIERHQERKLSSHRDLDTNARREEGALKLERLGHQHTARGRRSSREEALQMTP